MKKYWRGIGTFLFITSPLWVFVVTLIIANLLACRD